MDLTPLFWWILMPLLGLVTAAIAKDRGVPGSQLSWWIAGTFLFIIAIPLAIFMRPDPRVLEARALESGAEKKCPQCAELVKKEALKCRFCGYDFTAALPRLVPCPHCRREVPRDLTRCTFCRYDLRAA